MDLPMTKECEALRQEVELLAAENRRLLNALNERVVMPLRMTEDELNRRINSAMQTQPKYAGNSNFYMKGWDAAKVAPTVKAVLLEVGLVELNALNSKPAYPEAAVRAVWEHGYQKGRAGYLSGGAAYPSRAEEVGRVFVEALRDA